MKHIYAVKDLAVQAFSDLMLFRAKGEAMRSFTDEVNGRGGQNSAIAAHPEDYEMYELGMYDETDGSIAMHDKPELLARAKDLKFQE